MLRPGRAIGARRSGTIWKAAGSNQWSIVWSEFLMLSASGWDDSTAAPVFVSRGKNTL